MLRSVFFVLTFLGLLTNAMAFETSLIKKCMVGVVDVGSTGSRLHVYVYDCDHQAEYVKEVWSKKINPGLTSIEFKQASVDAYLKNLFEGAPTHIPIYFYATAGMRLLSHDKQSVYYDAVKHWFDHASWDLIEAKTITGREEGVFAWLAVNHEQKSLLTDMHEKIGVMDMGGASVQIVTSVTSSDGKNPDDLVHVEVDHQDVTLFVHSFLGLGATLVSQQFLNNPECFPEGYPLPNGLIGHGDAEHCGEAVSQLINHVHAVNTVIQPILLSETPRTWYALGGLAYLLKEEPFRRNSVDMTNTGFLEQADSTTCRRLWSDLRTEYPDNERISQSCLLASYYHALIEQGYGLNFDKSIHLTSNDAETDWTLGVVLHQH